MPRTWTETLEDHAQTISSLRDQSTLLDDVATALIAAYRAGAKVLLCGNGGSAADAQHIAGELLGRFRAERRSLPAISLVSDSATLTAIANDYGYERVFSRQIEGLGAAGDILWVLSTSGRSPSILAACHAARTAGMRILGFTGRTGGDLPPLCDWLLRVPHDRTDRIQEGHAIAYHYLCEKVEAAFVG